MQERTIRWWHRVIGKDDAFFDLLEAGAQEAQTSSGLLRNYLQTLSQHGQPCESNDVAESRRRQKRIRSRIIEELNTTLMPPYDREDIQDLAFALYRIPKVVEKLVERIAIYPGRLPCEAFLKQVELLTIAADTVVSMVKLLHSNHNIETVTEANGRLQLAEGNADKMMLRLLQELYSSDHDEKEIVILSALYELMERAVDRCRDAGNIVVRIALKNA